MCGREDMPEDTHLHRPGRRLVLLYHFPRYSEPLHEQEARLPLLDLLASELLGSLVTSVLLTSAGVIDIHSHVWPFYMGVGDLNSSFLSTADTLVLP